MRKVLIDVLKPFRHSHMGYENISYEKGVQMVPEDAAKYALGNKLAKEATAAQAKKSGKETKDATKAPETK